MKTLIRTTIQKLRPYSSARSEFSGEATVFLDANENPYGTLNRYPDPNQVELKKMLSKRASFPVDGIFIGNGSDEIIDLVFRIFCEPSTDQGLIFTPTYGMYEVSGAINGVEMLRIPLEMPFEIDASLLEPWIDKPQVKVVFLCSPNNPTGNLISKTTVEQILATFKGIVVLDETYIDFATSDSLRELALENERLIVIQTMSKAWGLAAARVGIAYMNPALLPWFQAVKPPYNVSRLNAEAACFALSNVHEFELKLSNITSERERLLQILTNTRGIVRVFPSEANFILVECQKALELFNTLRESGIVVRNRSSEIPNCLRITVGTPEENTALIKTIQRFYTTNTL